LNLIWSQTNDGGLKWQGTVERYAAFAGGKIRNCSLKVSVATPISAHLSVAIMAQASMVSVEVSFQNSDSSFEKNKRQNVFMA
jgi:hypothetical protein